MRKRRGRGNRRSEKLQQGTERQGELPGAGYAPGSGAGKTYAELPGNSSPAERHGAGEPGTGKLPDGRHVPGAEEKYRRNFRKNVLRRGRHGAGKRHGAGGDCAGKRRGAGRDIFFRFRAAGGSFFPAFLPASGGVPRGSESPCVPCVPCSRVRSLSSGSVSSPYSRSSGSSRSSRFLPSRARFFRRRFPFPVLYSPFPHISPRVSCRPALPHAFCLLPSASRFMPSVLRVLCVLQCLPCLTVFLRSPAAPCLRTHSAGFSRLPSRLPPSAVCLIPSVSRCFTASPGAFPGAVPDALPARVFRFTVSFPALPRPVPRVYNFPYKRCT